MKNSCCILLLSTTVTLSKFGKKGKYVSFFPGSTMEVFLFPDENYKTTVEVRGRGRRFIFNGEIPRNVAVVGSKSDSTLVTVGKMPSTTHTDEKGKPIPTFWQFDLYTVDDKHRFLYLMTAASRDQKVVYGEDGGKKEEKKNAAMKKNKSIADNTKSTTVNKENIKNKTGNIQNKTPNGKKPGLKKIVEEYAGTPPTLTGELPSVTFGLSDFSDSDTDWDYSPAPKKTSEAINADESNFDSDADSLSSPVFAQSQELYPSAASTRWLFDE